MIASAKARVPRASATTILDCDDDPGAAQATIGAGVEAVIFNGRPDIAARLADIASQSGVRLLTERPAAVLDLGALFFASPDTLRRRCIDVLTAD
jgi:hypothetical protein